jgi:RNA polymerase sigma-70 factor (ECF subfamily)
VALNTAMNFNRKNKKASFFSFLDDYKQDEITDWLIEQEYDNKTETEILYQCIDELNEINKALILLYLDGKSHEEISEIIGISKTNVGTRIGRIKEEIKNLVTSKIQ